MYPYGWTEAALKEVENIARIFKADPRGLLAIWMSESGLQPRLGPVAGYYGLIMGRQEFVAPVIGQSWIDIVKSAPVEIQIKAIAMFWAKTAEAVLKEPLPTRAGKLGVRGDALLYALNFVPAYAAKMQSKTQPMVIGSAYAAKTGLRSPDNGVFYHDNPGFDLDGKGYINLIDIQKRIDRKKAEGMKDPKVGALFGAVSEPLWDKVKKPLAATAIGLAVWLGIKKLRG